MKGKSNKILSLVLALALTLSAFTLAPVTANSEGADGHWSAPAVAVCREYGVLNSAPDFNPDEIITRAEFCRMINRAFNFTEAKGAKEFSDVDYEGEYGNDLKIASAMGYVGLTE